MPTLKNVTSSNLIPVVDFEKLQNKDSNTSTGIEISYLISYVGSCLKTMSHECSSSALFILPTQPTDEILFKPFPSGRKIDLNLVGHYLDKQNNYSGKSSSMKPKGDTQKSPQSSPR